MFTNTKNNFSHKICQSVGTVSQIIRTSNEINYENEINEILLSQYLFKS